MSPPVSTARSAKNSATGASRRARSSRSGYHQALREQAQGGDGVQPGVVVRRFREEAPLVELGRRVEVHPSEWPIACCEGTKRAPLQEPGGDPARLGIVASSIARASRAWAWVHAGSGSSPVARSRSLSGATPRRAAGPREGTTRRRAPGRAASGRRWPRRTRRTHGARYPAGATGGGAGRSRSAPRPPHRAGTAARTPSGP